jgi:hypothetical protein
MSSNVSEEHIASIFRVEEDAKQKTNVKAGGKQSSCIYYRMPNAKQYH